MTSKSFAMASDIKRALSLDVLQMHFTVSGMRLRAVNPADKMIYEIEIKPTYKTRGQDMIGIEPELDRHDAEQVAEAEREKERRGRIEREIEDNFMDGGSVCEIITEAVNNMTLDELAALGKLIQDEKYFEAGAVLIGNIKKEARRTAERMVE